MTRSVTLRRGTKHKLRVLVVEFTIAYFLSYVLLYSIAAPLRSSSDLFSDWGASCTERQINALAKLQVPQVSSLSHCPALSILSADGA